MPAKNPKYWTPPPGGWSPETYVIDPATGEPVPNYRNRPTKKRGRKKSASAVKKPPAVKKSEPATDGIDDLTGAAIGEIDEIREYLPTGESTTWTGGSGETDPEPGAEYDGDGATVDPEPIPDPVQIAQNPVAELVVSGFLGAGCVVFGSGFAPADEAERMQLTKPTADYLATVGEINLPPWAVLVMAYGAYSVGKMADPSVRAKAVQRWNEFNENRKRKNAEKTGPKMDAENGRDAEPNAEPKPEPKPEPTALKTGDAYRVGSVPRGE